MQVESANSAPMMKPMPTKPPHLVTGVRKFVFLLLAFVFFVLGMIGVVLPGIPTTPFLLLMSYFLLRSSPKLHKKALGWPIVGKPLSDWQEHRGVRRRIKITAYLMVALVVGLSLMMSQLHWIGKLVVVCAAVLGIAIVYRLPTIDET